MTRTAATSETVKIPRPVYNRMIRGLDRVTVAVLLLVMLLAVFTSMVAGYKIGAADRSALFVDTVFEQYPTIDAPATDVFAYGWATCAALRDGWTAPGVAGWLSGTPYETLGRPGGEGAAFGQFVTDAAVAGLCPEAAR